MKGYDERRTYGVPLTLEPQSEGGYTVTSPSLPELITEGDTVEQALQHAREAFALLLEIYKDEGRSLPSDVTPDVTEGPIKSEGSKDLRIGTVRAVVLQLGLDWQDFTRA